MGKFIKSYASLSTSADPSQHRKFGDNKRTTSNGPDAQNLVRSEVYANFKYPKPTATNLKVPCCWHVQSEVFTRTLEINVVPHTDSKGREIQVGQYRCWSCGAKGIWNTLAKEKHMAELVETDNPDMATTVHHVAYEHSYAMPESDAMWELDSGWDWLKKGTVITNKTLLRAGARWFRCRIQVNGEWKKQTRLWLPANTQGEVVGHIGAYVGKKKDHPVPYLNSRGQWASHYFFGFDEAQKLARRWERKGYLKFCCVVEGPRDQLVMLQNNIPAVACLGVNSWSDAKANMLSVAFDYVFAVGDGDPAGRKLNRDVRDGLQGIVPVKVIKLPNKKDPASLTPSEYKEVVEIIIKYAVAA